MFDFLLGNDTLSAVIAFIIVLIPAVFIHELGHFLAAKAVGITILEFGIGMPPRAVKLFTLSGTDYTLNWLPLGGFVRPLGEDIVRQVEDEKVADDRSEALERGIKNPQSVNETKPLPRILFMAGGALANLLFALLLFVIIGLLGVPQTVGALTAVEAISAESTFAETELLPGDVIQTINGEYYATTAALAERLYTARDEILTLEVLRPVEGAIDPEMFTITLTPDFAERPLPTTHPIVLDIADGSPAQAAGVQARDLVLSFNGEPLDSVTALQARTRDHLDQVVTLDLLRAGEVVTVELTPRANPPDGQGAMGISISEAAYDEVLGLVYREAEQQNLVSLSFGESISYGAGRVADVLNVILSVPGEILSGTAEPEALRITGPVGISQVGAVFLQETIERDRPSILLEFMALISIALGFTNLLPIPALDGGRILFVLIEIVRGRPIAPEREGMVHLIGLALLLSLMVVVVLNDIANPLTDILRR